jgi:acetyltransferase-like isoleucine patch superfamily enzyme
MKKTTCGKIDSVKFYLCLAKTQLFYKLSFKYLGKGTFIYKPIRIINHKNIIIRSNVKILPNCRIEAVVNYNDILYDPIIEIDEGVSIQQNLHLTCANHVYIGRNTGISSNVTITDINHPYTDIETPIEEQNLEVKEVFIDCDCKIYNNAVILPGVTIGKHCVIGANSVVINSIPAYSVAVGAPARVIKRYNFKTQQWEKVKENVR